MKISYTVLLSLLIFTTNAQSNSTPTPHNTVFIWDIHNVILQKDWSRIASLARTAPLRQLLSLPFLKRATHLLWQRLHGIDITGDQFVQAALAQKHPELAHLIIQINNAQKPIKSTIAIIKDLKQQGFTHYIGSNIGTNTFHHLIDAEKNPLLAPIFLQNFNLKYPQTVTYNASISDNQIIRKPNTIFYHELITKNNINLKKVTAIFIDDKIENITAAQEYGLIAIHFTSAVQLQKELAKLGILLTIPANKQNDGHLQPYFGKDNSCQLNIHTQRSFT